MKILYQDDDTKVLEMSAHELLEHMKQQSSFKYEGFTIHCMGYDLTKGYHFVLDLWQDWQGGELEDEFYKVLRKTPKTFVWLHGCERKGVLQYEDGELFFGNTTADWRVFDLNKNMTKTFKTHAFFVNQAKAFINSYLAWKKQIIYKK